MPWRCWLIGGAIGIVLLGGFLSLSRGGIAAIFLAGAVCCVALARRKTLPGTLAVALLLGGLAVPASLALSGYDLLDQRVDDLAAASVERLDAGSGRRTIWAARTTAIPQYARLGAGIGTHGELHQRYLTVPASPSVEFTHAENSYLQLAFEAGLPGLALALAGIGLCAAWCLSGWRSGATRVALLAPALLAAASVAGFLVHNWPPAKIFMGDSGSLMLGFLIGAFAIQAVLKQAACFMLVVPLVLISVPVFDTAMAILRRKLAGRKIGEADRGHIHHRLQAHGLSRVQSLLLIAGLCIAMAGFCVLSVLMNSEFLALLLCCSLLAVLVIARVFGHDEIDMALQHLRAIATLLVDIIQVVPSRLLAVRLTNMAPGQSEDYWQIVCQRLAQCGGKDLEIRFTDLNSRNVVDRLCRRADAPALPATGTWQVRHTVPRDGGILATLTASGTVDDPQWAAKVNKASQLFHTLCRIWPLAPLPRGSRDEGRGFEADVIRFDDSHPQQPHSIASPGADANPLQQPRAA